jgi:nitrite reductase/ring-hydroxylating ferredoxin subunit
VTNRGVRSYIDDLLAGRRPKPFHPDAFEAAQIRTAIDLQAVRPHTDQPRPEFVDHLKTRIAEELSTNRTVDTKAVPPPRSAPSATRRQVIAGTTAAATVAVAAVSVDRLLIRKRTRGADVDSAEGQGSEIVPSEGSWQPVAKSSELSEGEVRSFDLGSVTGFVRRADDRVEAVSGVCTHQGCRLWFDQAAERLRCPCHVTSFSPAGQVLTHQLPVTPAPLPHFDVRENGGMIEVLAPPPSSEPT